VRRIPGQSVNLAHLIWRTPRAPAPLPSGNKVHPRWFSARGYGCWGQQQRVVIPDGEADPRPHAAMSNGVPALRYRFGGDDRSENQENTWKRFGAHSGHPTAVLIVRATSGSSSVRFLRKRIARDAAELRT
jgi:hypothetical protein